MQEQFDQREATEAIMLCAALAKQLGYNVQVRQDSELGDKWIELFIVLPDGQVSWDVRRRYSHVSFATYRGEYICDDGHSPGDSRRRLKSYVDKAFD